MKQETITITRFAQKGGFYVDVIPGKGDVSFWLGHKDADIKEQMFAASAAFAPQERWAELIGEDIEDYMADFREAWLED